MTEHVVTALEPVWVTTKLRPNTEGVPEYVGDSTELGDFIDSLADGCAYECTCGFESTTWFEVEEHFAEVADERE